MEEVLVMERNFVRDVGLLNPPKEMKSAKVKEWVANMGNQSFAGGGGCSG